jgi:fatty acid amide hydrolase
MRDTDTEQSHSPNPGLTRLSATELASLIRLGEISAAEVVEAFIGRIEEVNPKLNAVVYPNFENARTDAAKADADRRDGKPLGALHGVPLTVAECFDLKNAPTTLGLKSRAAHKAFADDVLVSRLRQAGAIVLGKTNVGQLTWGYETENPLYGRTSQPTNHKRSPGGSSGGEAAIIAAGGSPFGLATDFGGNLRIPAHVCGISGFKPTAGRLPFPGRFASRIMAGQEALAHDAGVLARSVNDIRLAFGVLTAPGLAAFEPMLPPASANPQDVDIAGLRIAIYSDDGVLPPSPAIRRAVREAARVLQAQGAEVELFKPPAVEHALRLYLGMLSADGGASLKRLLGKNKPSRAVRQFLRMTDFPAMFRPVASQLASRARQKRAAFRLRHVKPASAADYWTLVDERNAYRQKFLTALSDEGFDAIICPPHALPAAHAGNQVWAAASYALLYNLLGLPAGTVACTRVQPGEESDRLPSRDFAERSARSLEKGSAGLPVGVQVVAKPWQDHIVLAIMAVLEESFRREPDYPMFPNE